MKQTIRMVVAAALLGTPGFASMILTLHSPVTAMAGSTVTIEGTITPDTAADTFLNGIRYIFDGVAGTYLAGDQITFFNDTPGFYASVDSPYTGPIFSLTINPNTPSGNYTGTVTLLGGASESALDPKVLATFEVTVVTPEPRSIGLGLAGLAFLAATRRARSRRVY